MSKKNLLALLHLRRHWKGTSTISFYKIARFLPIISNLHYSGFLYPNWRNLAPDTWLLRNSFWVKSNTYVLRKKSRHSCQMKVSISIRSFWPEIRPIEKHPTFLDHGSTCIWKIEDQSHLLTIPASHSSMILAQNLTILPWELPIPLYPSCGKQRAVVSPFIPIFENGKIFIAS